jgi:hypothetical protein
MATVRLFVNPHPAPNARRLSQISERVLRDVVQLHRLGQIPSDRLELAGVPPLRGALRELQRRADACPTIPVIPVRGREAWLLSFACPWCPRRRGKPRTHTHGGGPIDEPPGGGHRVSHCYAEGAPHGYFLAIVEADAAVQR